jgi:hypothetical protein
MTTSARLRGDKIVLCPGCVAQLDVTSPLVAHVVSALSSASFDNVNGVDASTRAPGFAAPGSYVGWVPKRAAEP